MVYSLKNITYIIEMGNYLTFNKDHNTTASLNEDKSYDGIETSPSTEQNHSASLSDDSDEEEVPKKKEVTFDKEILTIDVPVSDPANLWQCPALSPSTTQILNQSRRKRKTLRAVGKRRKRKRSKSCVR